MNARLISVSCLVGMWCCAATPALAAWPEERSAGVFLVHADFSLADQKALLDELPRLQQDVCATLAVPAPREPIHIFLFARQETYRAYLARHFPKAPSRRAIYLKGRGPGMVFAYASDEWAADLRHECTHAVLHAALPEVPLWLDEGLAEYFEAPPGDRRRGSSHLSEVQALAEAGQTPRLELLERLTDLKNFGREEYRNAWAWTHFLLEGSPGGRRLLCDYVTELRDKMEPGPLSERIRSRLPQAERGLAEHLVALGRIPSAARDAARR